MAQRNMAKVNRSDFITRRSTEYRANTLTQSQRDERNGGTLSSGEVSVKIEMPDGDATVVPMENSRCDSWGLFEGRFAVTQSGMHRAVVACKETGSKLEAELFCSRLVAGTDRIAAKQRYWRKLPKLAVANPSLR